MSSHSLRAIVTLALLSAPIISGAQVASGTAKEKPPVPGTPKAFKVPPHRTITLANGMLVTFIPYGRVPKAAVELEIRTGTIDETTANDASLSAVTADMLLEGTTTRTAQDLSRVAAEMGGALSANGGAEAVTIGGEVLTDFAAAYVALVADVARNPRFADTDLKRVIDKHVRDNAITISQPGTIAQKAFREMTYGDHPFARIFPPEEVVRGFTVDRVRTFHAKNYGAKRAHLYVSGVFSEREMERRIREAFESWNPGELPTINPPKPAAKSQVAVIDRPKSVQSAMWMGVPVSDPSQADWNKLTVTDALLGGAFGSRITRNIREDKGYTYSPFSFLWSRKGAALWVEVADVTTNVTGASLKEIVGEMERLRAEAPPNAELTGTKNNLIGTFTLQNSSRGGLINQMQFANLHGLGDGYLRDYVKNIMAVTPEDVRATAMKHLDPKRLTVAIVGDKKAVDPQLGTFRPIVP